MAGVNKVIVLGNLGKDPEVKFMANGDAVANVTIATSESWKDKQTGEQKREGPDAGASSESTGPADKPDYFRLARRGGGA